nr:hypothetical protein [Tanacetum cinerariifolium]
LAGRGQQREGQQVGRHYHKQVVGVSVINKFLVVEYRAVGPRVLHDGPKQRLIAEVGRAVVTHHQLNAQGRG